MTVLAQHSLTYTPLRTRFIVDPSTGMLHRKECPASPGAGINFGDRELAVAEGYTCCTCAMPALVASAERIRTLLASTVLKR